MQMSRANIVKMYKMKQYVCVLNLLFRGEELKPLTLFYSLIQGESMRNQIDKQYQLQNWNWNMPSSVMRIYHVV